MVICPVCDAEMLVSDEEAKPILLITGDIETESERLAICTVCGHRQVIKD